MNEPRLSTYPAYAFGFGSFIPNAFSDPLNRKSKSKGFS